MVHTEFSTSSFFFLNNFVGRKLYFTVKKCYIFRGEMLYSSHVQVSSSLFETFLMMCPREGVSTHGSRVMFHCMSRLRNRPNLYLCSVLYVLYYISSLCSGDFADVTAGMCWFGVCWGHVTDVPRTGCTSHPVHIIL